MTDTKMIEREFGEVGLDSEASPGNGPYYIIHYDSGITEVGFDTVEEADEELCFIEENR